MTASAISRKRLLRSNVSMAHMQEVIFCEQRGMATEIGFLEVPTLIRQGISLPLHRYSYGRRLLGLQSKEV